LETSIVLVKVSVFPKGNSKVKTIEMESRTIHARIKPSRRDRSQPRIIARVIWVEVEIALQNALRNARRARALVNSAEKRTRSYGDYRRQLSKFLGRDSIIGLGSCLYAFM
jgi:hypothetical protein